MQKSLWIVKYCYFIKKSKEFHCSSIAYVWYSNLHTHYIVFTLKAKRKENIPYVKGKRQGFSRMAAFSWAVTDWRAHPGCNIEINYPPRVLTLVPTLHTVLTLALLAFFWSQWTFDQNRFKKPFLVFLNNSLSNRLSGCRIHSLLREQKVNKVLCERVHVNSKEFKRNSNRSLTHAIF